MDWESIRRGQKALPENPMLANLYALSRKIKGTEVNTTLSTSFADEVGKKNKYSNQFFMNTFGQISFITQGCKIGQCSFCSYGACDVKLTPKIVSEEMDKFKQAILERKKRGENIYAILLDSVGSILDKNEFSPECLEVVFKKLEELLNEVRTIESVSFETHYQTLGSYNENGEYVASDAIEQLIEFKNSHPEIGTYVVELGFETANSEIRDTLLFKHIDDETYKKSVELLHQNGIEVEVNVMATLPFLSQKEQIDQSVTSVLEALKPHKEGGFGVDSVTLFPLNVRKHTFCDYVFDVQDEFSKNHGSDRPAWMQKEFPIWSMVATLNGVIEAGRPELLNNISVAWFGGRQLSEDASEVYPKDWEETYDDFVLYRKNINGGENSRVNIIKRLARHPKFLEFMESVKREEDATIQPIDKASYIYSIINQMNLPYEKELDPKTKQ